MPKQTAPGVKALKVAMNKAIGDRKRGVLPDPYMRPDRAPTNGQPKTLGQLFAAKYPTMRPKATGKTRS